MDRHEFENRLRALDERLEASIEVLRGAHRIERRALELVWLTSPGNLDASGVPLALLANPAAPGSALSLAAFAGASAALPPAPAKKALPAPPKWRSADLAARVEELLPQMPEVFSRDDLLPHFGGNPPERSMLYRVIRDLVWAEEIEVEERGWGRTPVRYRRLPPAEAAAQDG